MKILVVAMTNSIHTVRNLSQISDQGWDIHLFPSIPSRVRLYDFLNIKVHWDRSSVKMDAPLSTMDKLIRKISPNIYKKWYGFKGFLGALSFFIEKHDPEHEIRRLVRLIKLFKPDIIHSMEFQSGGYLVSEAKKRFQGKFPIWVATNWGSDIYFYGQLQEHQLKIKEILQECDYYASECNRDVCLAKGLGLKGQPLPVLPNGGGYKLEKFIDWRQTPPSQRKTILLKGYQNIFGRALVGVKALELCADALKGYKVVIYSVEGSPPVAAAAEIFSKKTKIPVKIIPDRTSHKELMKIRGEARLHIGLSASDAISTSFLECLIMGCFPIQSDTSCSNEWAEHGKGAFFVPAEEPCEIAKFIRQALKDDKLVDDAAEINWQTAQARLPYNLLKMRTIAFYKAIKDQKKIPLNTKTKKIFVTGVYASGKTALAEKFAVEYPYYSYDDLYDYQKIDTGQAKKILNSLPDRFITDAIPATNDQWDHIWDDFIGYEKKYQPLVICTYCPDPKIWLERVRQKITNVPPKRPWWPKTVLKIKLVMLFLIKAAKRIIRQPFTVKGMYVKTKTFYRATYLPNVVEKIAPEPDLNPHRQAYWEFFAKALPYLKRFKNVKYYDSVNNKFTTLAEMLERIDFKRINLKYHLAQQTYDKNYQDIEVMDFKGYSDSIQTWENIKDIIKWKGKKVVDLGTFHGYFAFKIEDEGGEVVGLDNCQPALKTSRLINEARGGHVEFRFWTGGQAVPKADITLGLNVLHHFADKDLSLSKIKNPIAIFEINRPDRVVIEKYFRNIKEYPSHRQNRVILVGKRRSVK